MTRLLFFFVSLFPFLLNSQTKYEVNQMEKEDALMEIIVKEKQREIEEEKRAILEEEAKYNRTYGVLSNKKYFYYDFFLPGLGHYMRENYFKSFVFGFGFWTGVYYMTFHYQAARHLSSRIETESIYNPFVSFYLLPSYKHHNQQSQILSAVTLGLYLFNLFISFQDESQIEFSFQPKTENLNFVNFTIYEFKLSFVY